VGASLLTEISDRPQFVECIQNKRIVLQSIFSAFFFGKDFVGLMMDNVYILYTDGVTQIAKETPNQRLEI